MRSTEDRVCSGHASGHAGAGPRPGAPAHRQGHRDNCGARGATGIGERGRFLVSTVAWGNNSSRGYFHADPSEGFAAVAFAEPAGNYRSTELRLAGISRMVLIREGGGGSGGTVFALSESKGLWATPSYLSGEHNDPDWRWE